MAHREQLAFDVLEEASRVLRVLTHPDRLRLCSLLLDEELSVNELCAATGLKQSAVSQHLNQLRAHGILSPKKVGKNTYYLVTHPAPGWLLECIRKHCCR